MISSDGVGNNICLTSLESSLKCCFFVVANEGFGGKFNVTFWSIVEPVFVTELTLKSEEREAEHILFRR